MSATRAREDVLSIPGRVHSICIEGSEVPEEEGWPSPERQRRGTGWRFVYTVTPEQREQIITHVQDIYDGSSGFGDEDASRDRAAMRAWLRTLGRLDGRY